MKRGSASTDFLVPCSCIVSVEWETKLGEKQHVGYSICKKASMTNSAVRLKDMPSILDLKWAAISCASTTSWCWLISDISAQIDLLSPQLCWQTSACRRAKEEQGGTGTELRIPLSPDLQPRCQHKVRPGPKWCYVISYYVGKGDGFSTCLASVLSAQPAFSLFGFGPYIIRRLHGCFCVCTSHTSIACIF